MQFPLNELLSTSRVEDSKLIFYSYMIILIFKSDDKNVKDFLPATFP